MRKTLEELRRLWDEFSEVPVDNDDAIERDFHGFESGTCRMDVWSWFDEKCPNGLVKDLVWSRRDR